jgi:large subunit ribosomal protein L19
MLQSFVRKVPILRQPPFLLSNSLNFRAGAFFSTQAAVATPQTTDSLSDDNGGVSVAPEDRPFLHHGLRPRYRNKPKFKSPQKRASKLLHELTTETVQKYTAAKPAVWETDFRVGDAVELDVVTQGGINSDKLEKMRGVVLGIFKKQLDTSILIRDVLYGEPIERRIPLHSPLVKSLKVLERNFVFKGKKKVKRAKLYYLSDRNPLGKYIPSC